jgi:Protein of unknown function (DUF2911)
LKILQYVFLILLAYSITTISCTQKHKSKRKSPPAETSQKVGETNIRISYGQPSIKGRTIGVNLEPFPDSLWRAGANEATVFEVDKDVLVEGKLLPKGKYAFFVSQKGGRTWILVFNKIWNQWGTKDYKEADDIFRVPVRGSKAEVFTEQLIYKINPDGIVSLIWGEKQINFQVQEKK